MPHHVLMLASPLAAALAAGVTVVTPNQRLARDLATRHDERCRSEGLRSWPAARTLPWPAWLGVLRQDVLAGAATSSPLRLLGAIESAFLWQRIVAGDALQAVPLIDAAGVANLAADAWNLVHAWGAGGESWRGWSGGDDEPAAFSRWADRYAAALAREGAIDLARLPDALTRAAPEISAWHGAGVLLAGFVELTSQQQRLVAALATAGMRIDHCALPSSRTGAAHRASAPDPHTELGQALAWARTQSLADPGARIGIAVPDLARRRHEARALAEDILCPKLQWPGCEDEQRPYELSLGESLADIPLVAAALGAIAMLDGAQRCGEVAAWLRSPYLAGGPDAWLERAALERTWIDVGRTSITLAEVLTALERCDAALAGRLREARRRVLLPARATPRQWVGIWRDWFAASSWPGERSLGSAEFQARGAFEDALTGFASIVSAEIPHAEARAALGTLVRSEIFQPEGTNAPIRILGLLEAAGLEFDALWVVGLTADVWPRTPQPNPFIPLAWQVERDVPHASARRDLAFARTLTDQLTRAAPIVVMSYAKREDDHESAASPLIEQLPEWTGAPPEVPNTAAEMFGSRPRLESVSDTRSPRYRATGPTRGGARLIEAQSDCPFKAQAQFRLHADPWPIAGVGLTQAERGTLVHELLKAFWRELGDHASFVALTPAQLDAQVDRATTLALASLGTDRWRLLPPLVAAGEHARLARAAAAWLEAVDRGRPAFRVRGTEADVPLRLGEIDLAVRLDRWDELESGGCAIIDYKTGARVSVARWFSARPEVPQLGLYALALEAAEPAVKVRAAAYAYVRPGECGTQGVAADASAWPGLTLAADVGAPGIASWRDIQLFWSSALRALADEFVAGHAGVDPRKPGVTCRSCRRMPLCRIDLAEPVDDAEATESDDD